MSDKLNFYYLRTRRLNKFKGICENFEKDQSYKVSISEGRISYKSDIRTSTPGYRYISTAIEKFEKEEQSVKRFRQIFLPAFRKTAVYFHNKDNEDLEKLYSALRKLDDEEDEFSFEEEIREYVQQLSKVKVDYPAIVSSGTLYISKNTYSNLLEKNNPKAVYLPEGDYRFTLKTKAGNSTANKEVKDDCTVEFRIGDKDADETSKSTENETGETDKPYKEGKKQGVKVESEVFNKEDTEPKTKEDNEESARDSETQHEDNKKGEKLGLIKKFKQLIGF